MAEEPPPIPGAPPAPKRVRRTVIDDAEFDRITRHNRLRWIAIVASSPLLFGLFYLGVALGGCLAGFVVLGLTSPLLHTLWTKAFPGSRLYGSMAYKNFAQKRQLAEYRARHEDAEQEKDRPDWWR